MLDGSHSFTTVGETSVTFSFLDSTYTCTLYLYNTAISNYYGISNLSDLNISINKDADISELKDKIIGKICEIEYFEAVDGFNTKYIKLTEEMLDFSEIDLSITDTQSIKLSIDNNTFEIYVTIY